MLVTDIVLITKSYTQIQCSCSTAYDVIYNRNKMTCTLHDVQLTSRLVNPICKTRSYDKLYYHDVTVDIMETSMQTSRVIKKKRHIKITIINPINLP